MAAWTTAAMVIDSWIGEGAPSNTGQIDIWIARAERLLRKKVSNLQARIDIPEPDLLETVQDVVSNMVQRVFRNPTGTRQKSSTTGPFSEQETYGGDQPGYLWATDDELAALLGTSDGKAFSIDTMPVGAGSVYASISDTWF